VAVIILELSFGLTGSWAVTSREAAIANEAKRAKKYAGTFHPPENKLDFIQARDVRKNGTHAKKAVRTDGLPLVND
jgi:hypothetical protein